MKNKNTVLNCFLAIYILIIVFIFTVKTPNLNSLYDRISSIKINRENGNNNINMIPFRTIGSYLKLLGESFSLFNVIGNILPFIPLGVLVSFKVERFKMIKCFFLSAGISFIIELIQYIYYLGYADIDDIILNTIGCIGGYFLYSIVLD